jgi:hypothetical protein
LDAIHLPSERFQTEYQDSLLRRLEKVPSVCRMVVHCWYCKMRGPSCATFLLSKLSQLGNTPSQLDNRVRPLKVFLLEGGLYKWVQEGPADLLENIASKDGHEWFSTL